MRPIAGQPGFFYAAGLGGLSEEVKSQPVRLVDVFVIGPMMIAGGRAWEKTNPWAGVVLSLLGVSTIVYNASNYWKIEKARR
jgi:hypothetical protein